jgi:aminopeptidase N
MPKPQHTFMRQNQKTKVRQDAEDSKALSKKDAAQQSRDFMEELLKRAKLDSQRLPSGIKILEDAQKSIKDKLDRTTLGKIIKIIENGKELAEEVIKQADKYTELKATLAVPAKAAIRAPDLKDGMAAGDAVAIASVVVIFLKAVQKYMK